MTWTHPACIDFIRVLYTCSSTCLLIVGRDVPQVAVSQTQQLCYTGIVPLLCLHSIQLTAELYELDKQWTNLNCEQIKLILIKVKY